jgi:hypothetical protein
MNQKCMGIQFYLTLIHVIVCINMCISADLKIDKVLRPTWSKKDRLDEPRRGLKDSIKCCNLQQKRCPIARPYGARSITLEGARTKKQTALIMYQKQTFQRLRSHTYVLIHGKDPLPYEFQDSVPYVGLPAAKTLVWKSINCLERPQQCIAAQQKRSRLAQRRQLRIHTGMI